MKPRPVKRVETPKPDGRVRELGMPPVLHGIIQQAVMLALHRSSDRTFCEYSNGFRPRRLTPQVVAASPQYIAQAYRWVVDLDSEKFFDRVNHARLTGQGQSHAEADSRISACRVYGKEGVQFRGCGDVARWNIVFPTVEYRARRVESSQELGRHLFRLSG